MSSYKDQRQHALSNAAKYLGSHVIREEPVRSFRFFCPYVKKRAEKGRVDHRPGFVTFQPTVDRGSFAYDSNYCFTLTWTPGHMTIVGDLGELTVVHYHAMSTLEEACNWLLSPDHHYLLSKTNKRREYAPDQTFSEFFRFLREEPIETYWGGKSPRWIMFDGERKQIVSHRWGQIEEYRAWRKQQPRGGQLNAEEETVFEWFDNRPPSVFWDAEDEAWYRWRKILKVEYLSIEHFNYRTSTGRRRIMAEVRPHFEHEQSAYQFLSSLGMDDPYLAYEYRPQAFFQIAAIQHGCRMILDRLARETAVAA